MNSVIVSAARTPIGTFQGTLSPLKAPQLGSTAIRAVVERAGIAPADVEEVILGHVLAAGVGQAPARQASMGAGLPEAVGAYTVNKVCGSGMKAVMLADLAIRAGDARVLVAGGMESMSNAPYLLPKARGGFRMGHGEIHDAILTDGLWDSFHDYHMGCTGELCAREYQVNRQEQDRFAARSYYKALSAQAECAFSREIVPVSIPDRKGESVLMEKDETPRETTEETLAGLKAAFEASGTVTAGNASKISDGAAALVVMAEDEAVRRGLQPLARIVGWGTHSREPEWLMMAPTDAIRKAVQRAGLELDSIDLFEINEPFAAATVAIIRELGVNEEKVNVHGGAVALGHPIGCTGARLLVTLVHALHRHGGRYGAAGLCLGGGEAVAMVVERM